MSRNRCSTQCRCGWDLCASTDLAECAPDTQGLLTLAEYVPGWAASQPDMGYGYRDDLVGAVLRYPPPKDYQGGVVREVLWEYVHLPKTEWYRWRRIHCPLCGRQYAGWYRRVPDRRYPDGTFGPSCLELYDTSFYHSFDDEPAAEDEASVCDPLHPWWLLFRAFWLDMQCIAMVLIVQEVRKALQED